MNEANHRPPATQLVGLIETIVHECKGWLPIPNPNPGEMTSRNGNLPAETRTRLAFLEDQLAKARRIEGGRAIVKIGTLKAGDEFEKINVGDRTMFAVEKPGPVATSFRIATGGPLDMMHNETYVKRL